MHTDINASTSRMWINPPMVYDDTIPRTHISNRITAIVHNIDSSFAA